MNIIKRILQDKISERIEPNKAVLLFGARRVGKTVLIRELIKEFKGQSMLLNGEDYDTIALLNERSISNYRHLLEGIDLLAIDEAQNIPEIGSKLKLIVDEVEGIKVGKINVDEQPELANQFRVMSIPTLVVMKNGKVVDSSVGVRPKAQIIKMLEAE